MKNVVWLAMLTLSLLFLAGECFATHRWVGFGIAIFQTVIWGIATYVVYVSRNDGKEVR